MVLSTEARAYIAELEHLGCARGIHPYAGDVRVSIDWHRQRRSGDLDKRVGILLDALQGVAYVKDAQVAELHAWRRDGSAAPGTVSVTIEPLAA
jgi:Holliday junction resolvase RusA-like endonuclease